MDTVQEGEGGMDWESRIDNISAPQVKQPACGNLLCSLGSSTQGSVMTYGESTEESAFLSSSLGIVPPSHIHTCIPGRAVFPLRLLQVTVGFGCSSTERF